MIVLFILGLVVGAVTFTTSTTSIFKGPRELLSKIHSKVEELIHCPWCSSFWLSLLILATSKVDMVPVFQIYILDLLVSVFAVMAVSGLLHAVLLIAYKPVSANMARRQIEKLKEKQNSNNN